MHRTFSSIHRRRARIQSIRVGIRPLTIHLLRLYLHRITCLLPSLQSAQERVSPVWTCSRLDHLERRTGARLFSRSSSIEYERLVVRQLIQARIQFSLRERNGTRRVLGLIEPF